MWTVKKTNQKILKRISFLEVHLILISSVNIDSVHLLDGKSRPKRTTNKRETFYDENRMDYGAGDDPFRLIPVVYYQKQQHAPFTVQVTSDVLVRIILYTHCSN